MPYRDPYGRLIDRFRRRRQALRIPLRELSHRVGVSDSLAGRWEIHDSRPSLFVAVCWAQAIGAELVLMSPPRDPDPCPEQLQLPF